MSQRSSFELRARLAQTSWPLAIALLIVVTVSAPTAYYILSVDDARGRAELTAAAAADDLVRDAALEPQLWRYNSVKILRHLREYRLRAGIAHLAVVDEHSATIDPGEPVPRDGALVWATAPIRIGDAEIGNVWVAISVAETRRAALLLGLGFGLLSALLCGLMVLIPLRMMTSAESQIRSLLEKLDRSRVDLEDRLSLSAKTAALQEEERRQISRDLHDSAGQALTAIRINLQRLADRPGDHARVLELARSTTELTDQALEEIRRALASLSPSILDDVGLDAALQRMCADVSERAAIDIRLEAALSGPGSALSPAVETACYRIVQEAVTNIVRHAEATSATVRVARSDRALEIAVVDDGRGFAGGPGPPAQGRGLTNMRERAELLGGSLHVETGRTGTSVLARLPLHGLHEVASKGE